MNNLIEIIEQFLSYSDEKLEELHNVNQELKDNLYHNEQNL